MDRSHHDPSGMNRDESQDRSGSMHGSENELNRDPMRGVSQGESSRDSGTPDRAARESLGGSREISDRERSPEDGMQGVAGERERLGGYGYDTPADLQQASDVEGPSEDELRSLERSDREDHSELR